MIIKNNNKFKKATIPFLFIIGLLLPLITSSQYHIHILITIIVWSIITLGLRLILLVGYLNAAQAGLMGIGAYASALLVMRLGFSFWHSILLAGFVSAFIAALLGFPILRIRGAYFVMATFAVTEVFRMIWMRWSGLFGGPSGISGIPRPDPINIFGMTIEFVGRIPYYYLALLLLIIVTVIMHRIDVTSLGRVFRSIPQSELLVESVGINLIRYKVLAFSIGAFFAGIGGAFYAHYFTYISPLDYTWTNSLIMLMYTIVGGTATVAGPIIGSFVLITIGEVLRPVEVYVPIFLGIILILILRFLPEGLISIPHRVGSLAFVRTMYNKLFSSKR